MILHVQNRLRVSNQRPDKEENGDFHEREFHRDFHERELGAAFSFLEFIQSRIPRDGGNDTSHWCLKGNGMFGKLRSLGGWHFLCGQRFMGRFLHWIILRLGGVFW